MMSQKIVSKSGVRFNINLILHIFWRIIWTQNNPYFKGLIALKIHGGAFKEKFEHLYWWVKAIF